MAGLLKGVLRIVQICLLAFIVYVTFPSTSALARGEITWDTAVEGIFTNTVVLALIGVLVIGLASYFLDSPLIRLAINVGLVLLLFAIFTGRLSPSEIADEIRAANLSATVSDTAERCGYDVTVERVGDGTRAVLRDADGGDPVGYIAGVLSDGVASIVDSLGNDVSVPCLTEEPPA